MSEAVPPVAREPKSAHPLGLPPGVHKLGAETFFGAKLQRYRLDNGLNVLVLVDKSAPVVSYHTWFRVGSRHERPTKTGLAHLFEHLMFNQTKNLAPGDFDKKLEESGAESNAATWVDWTYYYESVPKQRFGLVVELEAERLANLTMEAPQVESEKEVVANERRYRVDDDVEGAANELLYKTAFEKHSYHAPTIGWMEDILAFTPEDCRDFHKAYYAPNNATLIVVGDVREADCMARIAKAYGPIPASTIPEEDVVPEPPQTEERHAVLSRPTPSEKALIGYRGPSLGDVDHAPLTVLNEILTGGRASRLHRALLTDKELVTEQRGWVSTFRDPGLFEFGLTARIDQPIQPAIDAFDAEIERVCAELVSPEELERAKARLELGMLQGMDSAAGKAEQIGFYETLFGEPTWVERRLERYRNVGAGEIRTAARRCLRKEARTIVRVLVADEPDEPQGEDATEPTTPDATEGATEPASLAGSRTESTEVAQ